MIDIYQAGVPLIAGETLSALEVTLCFLAPLCAQFCLACPEPVRPSLPVHLHRPYKTQLPSLLCHSRLFKYLRLDDAQSGINRRPGKEARLSLNTQRGGPIPIALAGGYRHGRIPIAGIRP